MDRVHAFRYLKPFSSMFAMCSKFFKKRSAFAGYYVVCLDFIIDLMADTPLPGYLYARLCHASCKS